MQNIHTRPNVILLTLDTLRADMLSCYGYPEVITPNIDRLAMSGIRFAQAITGGSWTQAAFPVIMTSSYASMYGGCLGPLSAGRPSPLETLAASGYTTAGFSTTPLVSQTYGYRRGFEHFVDLLPGENDPKLRKIKGGEQFLRSPVTHQLAAIFGKRMRPARLYVSAETLVDSVGAWIQERSEPFFAWAHFMDIHWPYHLEETLTTPNEIARAWNDMGHLHRVNWKGGTINADQRDHYLDLYKQAVRYTDAHIGRMLEILERESLLENTVVILVSDHGEEFLERGQWGHFETNLYDEILHVPLILTVPGFPGGRVEERQVRTLDIMPTILDMCGCQPPEGLEGTSLVPLWSGDGVVDQAPPSISEMWRDNRHIVAIRTESYKYIWDSRYPERPMLFDLKADPEERQNVIAGHPELARQFQIQLDDHLKRGAETMDGAAAAEPELEVEMIRRLRDLGYVE